jgi:hypothetical protein
MSFMRVLPLSFAMITALGACTRSSLPSDQAGDETPPSSTTGTSGTQQSDWNAIEQIEAQAKAIARIDGCTASSDCRAAPVGSRACGGPRYYIPWCARTTDSAALARKLQEVAKAEEAYNRKYDVMSTCEMRLPPVVEASGGACVTR